MHTGKLIRLGAWMPRGRAFLAALDEVIPRGLGAAAEPGATLLWLSQIGVDGVVLHAGIAARYAGLLAECRLPWIMKLTTNSAWRRDRTVRGAIGSVEMALALGASGTAVNVFAGSDWEKEHFTLLTETVESGERWGMPVIAFINPPVEKQFDPDALAYAARIGAELGADVIKTDFSGDLASFAQVIAACPAPVLVEDTPLPETPEGTLRTVLESLQAGGAGVLLGHRLWGKQGRDALAEEIRKKIHDQER